VIGYAPNEFVGKRADSLIHPEDAKQLSKLSRQLVRDGGRVVSASFRAKHKDGSLRWFEGVGTNLLEDPDVGAIVANYRDITDRRRVEDAKVEFVSLASHQLRTPLSTMKWYLDILVRGQARKKAKQYTERVVTANERMIALVEDLLQISRLELGTAVGKKEKVNLRAVLIAVMDEVVPLTEKKRLTIVLPPRSAITLAVADRRFARMMMLNLVSNAIKYTPEGGSVRMSFHSLDRLPRTPTFRGKQKQKAHGFVVFTIEDTGWGIPADEQAQIFTKFFRGRNIAKRDHSGTGLGLHLVELLATQTGGGVWFESAEGKGSTFNLAFPMHGLKKAASARKK
jgi:PAS domain S-box-containing protein